MQKVAVSMLFSFWIAQIAYAEGNLSLVGEEISRIAGADPSCTFMLRVTNTDESNPVAFSGWQLACKIIKSPDATGTVSFSSASKPVTDYVFDGVSNSFLDTTKYAEQFDTIGPIFGYTDTGGYTDTVVTVTVPTTGANLLQMGLTVATDAKGRFDIAVVPDEATGLDGSLPGNYIGAAWLSADGMRREFSKMSFGSDPVVVGYVLIVPEPASAMLLLSGTAVLLILASLNAKRRKQPQTHRVF